MYALSQTFTIGYHKGNWDTDRPVADRKRKDIYDISHELPMGVERS